MRKLFLALFLIFLAAWAFADFPGSPIGGGGGGSGSTTTDASLLVSGTLPAARIGDNSVLPNKLNAIDATTPTNFTYYMGDGRWTRYITNGRAVNYLDFYENIGGSNIGAIAASAVGGFEFSSGNGIRTVFTSDNNIFFEGRNAPTDIQMAGTLFVGAGDKVFPGYFSLYSANYNGFFDNNIIFRGSLIPMFADNTTANISPTELSYLDGVTSGIQTQLNAKQATLTSNDNLVVSTVTATQYVSSGADNTHSGNVMNTASPTTTNLAAGNYWTLKDEALRLRNQDNTATNILASAYKYRNIVFDNSAMDNMALIQNLPFTEVWDNVIYTIRGYTDGRVNGATTDNVTTNFYCCTNTDNTLAQCTKMFNTAPVPLGNATLSPAIDSGTCNAGSEIRISFSAINLSSKKLNIRARYLRR